MKNVRLFCTLDSHGEEVILLRCQKGQKCSLKRVSDCEVLLVPIAMHSARCGLLLHNTHLACLSVCVYVFVSREREPYKNG